MRASVFCVSASLSLSLSHSLSHTDAHSHSDCSSQVCFASTDTCCHRSLLCFCVPVTHTKHTIWNLFQRLMRKNCNLFQRDAGCRGGAGVEQHSDPLPGAAPPSRGVVLTAAPSDVGRSGDAGGVLVPAAAPSRGQRRPAPPGGVPLEEGGGAADGTRAEGTWCVCARVCYCASLCVCVCVCLCSCLRVSVCVCVEVFVCASVCAST